MPQFIYYTIRFAEGKTPTRTDIYILNLYKISSFTINSYADYNPADSS
jgi:hypothetical protein